MGRIAMFAFVAALGFVLTAQGKDGWLEKFDAAKKAAADKNLPILVDFSGSNWCGWCKKLDKEVFSQKEFMDYAAKNFVLLLIDVPNPQKPSVEAQELMKIYGVNGFPTVLVLSADGKELVRTGYQEGGAAAYIKYLESIKPKK